MACQLPPGGLSSTKTCERAASGSCRSSRHVGCAPQPRSTPGCCSASKRSAAASAARRQQQRNRRAGVEGGSLWLDRVRNSEGNRWCAGLTIRSPTQSSGERGDRIARDEAARLQLEVVRQPVGQ
eukprot:380324-Prymnesium_polylepis.1